MCSRISGRRLSFNGGLELRGLRSEISPTRRASEASSKRDRGLVEVFVWAVKRGNAEVAGGGDAKAFGRALAEDLNAILKGPTIYDETNFERVALPPLIRAAAKDDENQTPATRLRLNRRMLEEAYPGEIARSLGGVYPDTEIHTASEGELKVSEDQYSADAGRRYMHDKTHPDEPRQVKPGEQIVEQPNGQIAFGGTAAVMGINGYVTKVMFDANPGHEFYVEESFPMEWMYPYLTPYGIIMKVNRQPLAELPDDLVARDHEFWKAYSVRLVGDWVNYDTQRQQLCDFASRSICVMITTNSRAT